MEIAIRQYEERDKEALKKFIEDLQDHEAELDPFGLIVRKEGFGGAYISYLLERLKKENGIVHVAESAGAVIGIIASVILHYGEHETLGRSSSHPYGYITDLFVAKDFRGKDVGKRLMETAEAYFRSNGCDFSTVGVLAPNRGAYDFYRKIGYADRYVDFIKKLK
jgi:ribosomal protein S18 acetylase RimI-like enzyme